MMNGDSPALGTGPEPVAAGETDRLRIRELEEQVAALAHALAEKEREANGYLAACNERVGHLEAEIAALTEATIERAKQHAAEIAAYQHAYTERVGHLEGHVAALTEAAIEREKVSQDRNYQLVMIHQNLMAEFKDLDSNFLDVYERCKTFSMTAIERLFSLHKCVEYVCAAGVAGDLAECGVWRGGSCMLMAFGLLRASDTGRRIYLYDTFAGHPPPDPAKDVDLWGNRGIDDWRAQESAGTLREWGAASLAEVRENLLSTCYPEDRLIFVEGMVETTLPATAPEKLALLRLDSDWYESTRVALRHLYPRLAEGGVLIIDDYGHYRGQRQAVDEYFAEIGERPLLHRIDYSCRVMVKRSA
jgi:O-methyltransferase